MAPLYWRVHDNAYGSSAAWSGMAPALGQAALLQTSTGRQVSARICSTRCIGATGARCIGTIGMVCPGTLFIGDNGAFLCIPMKIGGQTRARAQVLCLEADATVSEQGFDFAAPSNDLTVVQAGLDEGLLSFFLPRSRFYGESLQLQGISVTNNSAPSYHPHRPPRPSARSSASRGARSRPGATGGSSAGRRRRSAGGCRDTSGCHFRKTATEFGRRPGIKWLSGTAK
jgi:hypothetical protein